MAFGMFIIAVAKLAWRPSFVILKWIVADRTLLASDLTDLIRHAVLDDVVLDSSTVRGGRTTPRSRMSDSSRRALQSTAISHLCSHVRAMTRTIKSAIGRLVEI